MAKGKGGPRKSRVWSIAGIIAGVTTTLALLYPFKNTGNQIFSGSPAATIWNAATVDAQNYWTNLSLMSVAAPSLVYAGGRYVAGRVPVGTGKVVLF